MDVSEEDPSMIPQPYFRLAQMIHEERIEAAQRRRPEWSYVLPLARRQNGAGRRVRALAAHGLRWIATAIGPSGATWQTTSNRPPAPTR
jgi:hypothetical protein